MIDIEHINKNLLEFPISVQFANYFMLSLSDQKLIHAFWLFDSLGTNVIQNNDLNEIFEEIFQFLIDPCVEIDKFWLNKIIRTFYDWSAFPQVTKVYLLNNIVLIFF